MPFELTMPERLLIDRRRRGETQAEAAQRHSVSNTRYSRWERGLDQPPPTSIPTIVKDLRPHELCLITRRRAGVTQTKVATEINRCKMWVRQMERGEVDCSELSRYWGL